MFLKLKVLKLKKQYDIIALDGRQKYGGKYMLKHFQKLGGALFAPVLLFPFAGIMVALTIVLKNPDFVGGLADPNGIFIRLLWLSKRVDGQYSDSCL